VGTPVVGLVNEWALRDVADEVVELVLRKNADYGDAWQVYGLAGILVRLSDKAMRVERLAQGEALVVEEGARDTLMDMVGYCLLGLLLIDSQSGGCS